MFNLLLSIGQLKAKIVAAIVATTTSYLLNRQWTYQAATEEHAPGIHAVLPAQRHRSAHPSSVLAVAKYGLGFSETNSDDRLALNIASALGIGLATVFRFWAYRTFVFQPPVISGDPQVTADAELEAEVEALEVALTEVAVAPGPRYSHDDDRATS